MISKYVPDTYSVDYKEGSKVRFQSIRARVGVFLAGKTLDADLPNPFVEELGILESAGWDLNYEWVIPKEPQYLTITSFDVIEHLANPLLYLREIYARLTKGGMLILTTPVAYHWALPIPKQKEHFHEFTEEELRLLLEEVGFEITRFERMRSFTWRWRFLGIRPIIRLIRDLIWGNHFLVVAMKTRDTKDEDK